MNKPKIGVVASTGGLNCLATLGIMNFIKEHNIKITAAAGSSGGSFPLAAYCCGLDLRTLTGDKIAVELKKSFFDPDRKSILWILLEMVGYVLGLSKKSPLKGIEAMGFCNGDGLLKLLQEKFGNLTFKDTIIPFYVCGWNLREKCTDLFHRNGLNPTIAEAIRMTCSIPLIFRPYRYNDGLYWDGGITASLPVKELLQNEPGVNFVILVDTVSGNDLIINPLNKQFSFLHALNDIVIGLQNTQVQESITYATEKLGEENVLILTPPHRCGWSHFDKIPEIIDSGYQLAKNAFKYNKKLQAALEMYEN